MKEIYENWLVHRQEMSDRQEKISRRLGQSAGVKFELEASWKGKYYISGPILY